MSRRYSTRWANWSQGGSIVCVLRHRTGGQAPAARGQVPEGYFRAYHCRLQGCTIPNVALLYLRLSAPCLRVMYRNGSLRMRGSCPWTVRCSKAPLHQRQSIVSIKSEDLVMQSLFRAVSSKRQEPGVIHHLRPGKPVLLP
jgi:hypothetical protein